MIVLEEMLGLGPSSGEPSCTLPFPLTSALINRGLLLTQMLRAFFLLGFHLCQACSSVRDLWASSLSASLPGSSLHLT